MFLKLDHKKHTYVYCNVVMIGRYLSWGWIKSIGSQAKRTLSTCEGEIFTVESTQTQIWITVNSAVKLRVSPSDRLCIVTFSWTSHDCCLRKRYCFAFVGKSRGVMNNCSCPLHQIKLYLSVSCIRNSKYKEDEFQEFHGIDKGSSNLRKTCQSLCPSICVWIQVNKVNKLVSNIKALLTSEGEVLVVLNNLLNTFVQMLYLHLNN